MARAAKPAGKPKNWKKLGIDRKNWKNLREKSGQKWANVNKVLIYKIFSLFLLTFAKIADILFKDGVPCGAAAQKYKKFLN